MKNLTEINTTQKCWRCEKIGFYIETPQGGDFVTCPCCNGGDFWSGLFYGERSKEMKEVFEKNVTKYFGNDDDNKNDKNDKNSGDLNDTHIPILNSIESNCLHLDTIVENSFTICTYIFWEKFYIFFNSAPGPEQGRTN